MKEFADFKIIPVNWLDGGSPARVHRKNKEIFLNMAIWDKLPEPYRKFIFLHEIGHSVLDTNNEYAADQFASDNLLGTEPLSIKNSVLALAEVLNMNNEEHQSRMIEQLKRAINFDKQNNTYMKTSNFDGVGIQLDGIPRRIIRRGGNGTAGGGTSVVNNIVTDPKDKVSTTIVDNCECEQKPKAQKENPVFGATMQERGKRKAGKPASANAVKPVRPLGLSEQWFGILAISVLTAIVVIVVTSIIAD